ncbi:hypothetical protein PR202_ga03216 [Eleusine coracana subsp. coracana]|uniref:Enoyl reductase (ER) domain-containing protein n=1 Tax=Eleusine coracana subsp. coracana TaxID=191504 RepID=A0AAV5BMZ0_ELECO|nr:hypothetical protein PR202_ga03216 [Eleusine coracana subsp. coracana]
MRAVVITRGGGPEVLEAREVEDPPQLGEGEVLIEVAAAGVNRADTLQRHGRHPPPAGASPYPGLECSGAIVALGSNVPSRWSVGDKVCALLSGGGYAEKVVVPAGHLLPLPEGVSLTDAAGLPEVACTVWSTVFMTSHLSPGESFLIHGGSSGIGTFAIQIAKHLGIKVFVTAGVDVILDNIGGSYLQRNLNSLGVDGRLFIIGFQGGAKAEVNLQAVLARRLTIQAAGLRGRSLANKAQIVSEVEKNVWPAIVAGKVKPVIYKTFPLAEAAEAHKLMESSSHIGKILLIP